MIEVRDISEKIAQLASSVRSSEAFQEQLQQTMRFKKYVNVVLLEAESVDVEEVPVEVFEPSPDVLGHAIGEPLMLTARSSAECCTTNQARSAYCIDLGEGRTLRPTCYTLRHGSYDTENFIRSWRLEGSADLSEETWPILHEERDNSVIDRPFGSATFRISREENWYRYLRVVQLAENSSGANVLCLWYVFMF